MRTRNVADWAQLGICNPLKRRGRYAGKLRLKYGMSAENGGVETAKNHKI